MRTQAPKQITLILVIVLWAIGLLTYLSVLPIPSNIGIWCLVAAGGLAILGCLVDGI